MVRPSMTSSTPMISEPEPAVVDMASVMLAELEVGVREVRDGQPAEQR